MLQEQTPQVSCSNAQPFGQRLNRKLPGHRIVDETPRAAHGGRGAVPGGSAGSHLRTTAEAGTKSGLGRRGGGWEVADVRLPRRLGRADGPAVDPGGEDADEEPAVEPRVARLARPLPGLRVERELHGPTIPDRGRPD